ncbi:lipoprotein signal peptidase [Legionella quinlivanii]|uniref:Lipoprotein signal peptidase n=1 Tax=Legionella quinlivanii TaxID=45073 RepID=A0A0W0Y507_9GAMM|nr:signal peptidase II [Legionella quinlivanii]KTD51730.1 lipoprotein signal peptidase [Legionella quinlivanii]MCW8451067.1 signal peptidase II [Legionella quinlivanii]SEF64495.1 signal peptidase II [Legionella quinlivanii DSM 21216]STY10742.1 signal peptidase II [Legionella quinlivanii]
MKKWHWFIISILVIALDQISKYWASTHLVAYQPEPLIPMVNFTLAYNTGAAFSFLSGTGSWHRWFFAGFSIVMSIALIIWLVRLPNKAILQSLAVSLILGGAIGNLYDRALLGHVIDFIDVYYQNYHWPVFNLADSAICLGALFLLLDLCKSPVR